MLFALGSNGSGQLGVGHKDDANEPTLCILPTGGDSGLQVVSVSAGGNHTLIQLPGQVMATGDASTGSYPLANKSLDVKQSNTINLSLMSITQSSATWEASTFIDNIDRVFTCGVGNKGELGLGKPISQAAEPQMIKNFPPQDGNGEEQSVVDLASGMGHTVAVLFDGSVYGWGAGRKGQLGDPAESIWFPRRIGGVEFEVYRAVCGSEFTYVVGAPGSGNHMVLGSDKWGVKSFAPENLPPWKDIGASWGSIFVLLESGEVLSWGRNDHGQLGPPGLPKIRQSAVGSEHVVALTDAGEVITWGWGEHGNCGSPVDENGDVKARWNTLTVPGEVITLGAGCATTFIETLDEKQ